MRLLISLLILLLLFSCKKGEEYALAEIQFLSPRNGESYTAGDTVWIEAQIKSEREIQSIRLSLIEKSTKRIAGDLKYFQTSSTSYHLQHSYVLKDKDWDKEAYYFELLVNNGKESAAFTSIVINSQRVQRRGFVFIVSNALELEFYKQIFPNSFEKFYTTTGSFGASEINSIDQQLWFIPKQKTNAIVFDLKNNLVIQQLPAPTTQQTDAFSNLYMDNRQVFIALTNGTLEGYNYQLIKNFIYTSSEGYHPTHLDVYGEYILVVEKPKVFGQSKISLLYRISGGVVSHSILSKNVVGLCMYSEDKAFLAVQNPTGLELLNYDIQRGAATSLLHRNSPNEKLLLFKEISKGEFLLVSNQSVVNYKLPYEVVKTIHQVLDFAYYDTLENELLLVNEDTLFIRDAQTLSLKRSIVLPFQLEAALPWNE